MTREKTNQTFLYTLLFIALVFIPLAMFPDGSRFNVAKSKSFLLTLVLVSYLLYCLVKRDFKFQLKDPVNIVLFMYLAWMIFSSFFAMDPIRALLGSKPRMDGILSFLGYMTVYYLARRVSIGDKLLKAMAISASLIGVYAILQFFHWDPSFLQLYPESWIGVAFSTMGNPNFLGSYIVLMIPLGIYYYFYKEENWGVLFYGLMLFTLLCTRTRGAWIGGFFAFIIMLYFFFKDKTSNKEFLRKVGIAILVSLVVLMLFILVSQGDFFKEFLSIFFDFGKVISDFDNAEHAGSHRIYIWEKSVQLIKKSPWVGFGVENMSLAMRQYFYDDVVAEFGRYLNFDKSHNEYLNIGVSSGIPSLLLYLTFLVILFKRALKNRKGQPLRTLFITMAWGYVIQAFFNIQMVSVYYIFFAVLGMLSLENYTAEGGSVLNTEPVSESVTSE